MRSVVGQLTFTIAIVNVGKDNIYGILRWYIGRAARMRAFLNFRSAYMPLDENTRINSQCICNVAALHTGISINSSSKSAF